MAPQSGPLLPCRGMSACWHVGWSITGRFLAIRPRHTRARLAACTRSMVRGTPTQCRDSATVAATHPCPPAPRRYPRPSTWERPDTHGAEGATAPETLRQKDHGDARISRERRGGCSPTSADGIAISGTSDRWGAAGSDASDGDPACTSTRLHLYPSRSTAGACDRSASPSCSRSASACRAHTPSGRCAPRSTSRSVRWVRGLRQPALPGVTARKCILRTVGANER